MEDMAEIGQVEECWEILHRAGAREGDLCRSLYVDSAAIKAFCAERGGLVCTSSTRARPSSGPLPAAKNPLLPISISPHTGHAMASLTKWQSTTRADRAASRRMPRTDASSLERYIARSTSRSSRRRRQGARKVSRDQFIGIQSAASKCARRRRARIDRAPDQIVQLRTAGTSFAIAPRFTS